MNHNDSTFMNSEKSKTSDPHRLLLNLTDKTNLRRKDKYAASSNHSIYYTWKNIKKSDLRYQLQHGMENLNYLKDHILYQLFKIYFEYMLKKHATITDNPSIRIYINKIENKTTFKIKAGYYLKLLTREKMKLLGRTKIKVTKDENGGNALHLEITEVVLIQCNIVTID